MKVFSKQACRFVREVPGVKYIECESVTVSSGVVTDVPGWVKETAFWEMVQKGRSLVVLEDADAGITMEDGLRSYPQVDRYLKGPNTHVVAQKALREMQL
jgi:hypothetical protein